MADAVWRPLPGWKRHAVSSLGQVKIRATGRILKQRLDRDGYPIITLSEGGDQRVIAVHILVCSAFHGRRPLGCEVAHNDGDKLNNAASNLRWATPRENNADRILHGTSNTGERQGLAKLTAEAVIAIRQRCKNREPHKKIAADYGVETSNISSIHRRRTWRHI